MFATDSLGRPVIGSRETVGAMTRDDICGFYSTWYRPENTVVVAAGNVDHDDLVANVSERFEAAGWFGEPRAATKPRVSEPANPSIGAVHVVNRPTEQAHLVFGAPGIDHRDERRYALGVMNAALGGGMSSRLFQEVREKRGLAYAVYSFAQQFSGSGLFGVYAGTVPTRAAELAEVVRDELKSVAKSGLTVEEIERGKGQVKGGLVLGLEETSARMTRFGKTELTTGEHLSVSEVLSKVAAVDKDQIAELGESMLSHPLSVTGVGPFENDEALRGAVVV
jgi:predicted Zn-dependent peptidase